MVENLVVRTKKEAMLIGKNDVFGGETE